MAIAFMPIKWMNTQKGVSGITLSCYTKTISNNLFRQKFPHCLLNNVIMSNEYPNESVFLISLYCMKMVHHWPKGLLIGHCAVLFGPYGTVNCLLIGSRCIHNGAHKDHIWANLDNASRRTCIKNSGMSHGLITGVWLQDLNFCCLE